MLDNDVAQRLQIDVAACRRHYDKLRTAPSCDAKVSEIYSERELPIIADPDRMIYSGGFFGTQDKRTMTQIQSASAKQLATQNFVFEDHRLPELLFRYRARNFPDSLKQEETLQWLEFCNDRLSGVDADFPHGFEDYQKKIQHLLDDADKTEQQRGILMQLQEWGENLQEALREVVV
jgi:exodeoxyribonuclease-1